MNDLILDKGLDFLSAVPCSFSPGHQGRGRSTLLFLVSKLKLHSWSNSQLTCSYQFYYSNQKKKNRGRFFVDCILFPVPSALEPWRSRPRSFSISIIEWLKVNFASSVVLHQDTFVVRWACVGRALILYLIHAQGARLMYHAACKVEFQPFNRLH